MDSDVTAALVEEHRQRIAAAAPEARVYLSGSSSVEGLAANDVDLVALVPDVARAADQVRGLYPPLHEDLWHDDWVAFRDPGPPQVDLVLTRSGTKEDAHHRRAWDLLAQDEGLLEEYRALKASTTDYEQRKAAFFERVVTLLIDGAYRHGYDRHPQDEWVGQVGLAGLNTFDRTEGGKPL
jgi:GrpB-like predicted nucleotidyltransferase (UPF0157 family)